MASNTICPWSFLASPPKPAAPSDLSLPSCASTLSPKIPHTNHKKLLLLPLNRLPKPCLKGDPLAIKISKSEYQAGWADCKNILHGRFFLSKGDVPIKIWGPVGQVLDPVEAHWPLVHCSALKGLLRNCFLLWWRSVKCTIYGNLE